MPLDIEISFSKSGEIKGNAHSFFETRKGEFQNLTRVICAKAWSPIVWRDGKRTRKNFISSSIMAFDFDTGDWTLNDARSHCEKYFLPSIIATTKSHGKEKRTEGGEVLPACDRFRLVILADTCTNLDDFEHTMKTMMEWFEHCDKSCKDAARFYYPCKDIIYTNFDGKPASWLKCPKEQTESFRFEAQNHEGKKSWRNRAAIPPWIQQLIRYGVKPGGRHNEVYKIACNLTFMGFEENEILGLLQNFNSPLLAIGVEDARRCISNARNKVFEQRATGEKTKGPVA